MTARPARSVTRRSIPTGRLRLWQPRLPRGVRPCGPYRCRLWHVDARGGCGAGTGRRRPGGGRPGGGRSLARGRDREHDHGRLSRPHRDRRWRRRGRPISCSTDPGRAGHRVGTTALTASRWSPPNSGRGRARSGRRSMAPRPPDATVVPPGTRGASPPQPWSLPDERLAAPVPPDRADPWRERIRQPAAGERVPSDAELCAEFGVSRMTARNAMQRLAEDGLITREPGRGSFVATPHPFRRTNR